MPVIIALSQGPWVKRCLIVSLSFPHHSSCLMKNIFLFWTPGSPVHPLFTLSSLPAFTLDIFRSEQKLVAMATIINTSGILIGQHTCAHRQTWIHICIHNNQTNKQTTYISKKHKCALFRCAVFTAAVCVREITGWGQLVEKNWSTENFGPLW